MNGASEQTVHLGELRRYLLRHGWSRLDHPNDRIELLQTRPDSRGDYSTVALPISADFADAGSLINEALRLVSEHKRAVIARVVDRVQKWDRDVLRARTFLISGSEDSLPFEVAAE